MRIVSFVPALVALASLAGCKSDTKCTDWKAGYGERSTVTWNGCADSVQREVVCELLSPGKYNCQCMVAGKEAKTFEWLSSSLGDKKAATQTANDKCGWNLTIP
jgi:hypothetical protein